MGGRNFKFETKIIASISATVLIVVITGLFAYNSISGLIVNIKQETSPDMKVVMLKHIQSDLFEAENSVKSYSITGDVKYLEPFYQVASSIDGKINSLHKLSSDNMQQQQVADSLTMTIEQKFIILKEILFLQKDKEVDKILQKIATILLLSEINSKKMSSSIYKIELGEIPEKKAEVYQSNIIRRLFSETKKNAIKNENSGVKKQENKLIMASSLELIQKEKILTDKFRKYVLRFEELEGISINNKTMKAELMAKDTQSIIAAFCIGVFIVLFISGFVVAGYIKKTKTYNKAFKNVKIEAENLRKMRKSFLSNMSHEIKTPMNAIIGFTEQLLDTPLMREQREQIEVVKKSADYLISIVNDIQDYSKLGAGKFELDKNGFKPKEIIEEVISMMKPTCEDKKVRISCIINKSIPDILIGDAVRLKQVLTNVISNAVKYTDKGEIKIHCIGVLKNEKSIRLQVTIKDTGIGIPSSKTHKIFNEFEQAESDSIRKYSGTGLGLTITRKLLSLQNGNIQINSIEGRGTIVTISIPYDIGSIEDIHVEEKININRNRSIFEETTALIVDDEEYNRMLITTILKKWGIVYTEARNGQEAIEAFKKNKYDIVLMDIQMPVMNGIQATKYIRNNKTNGENNKAIPILALMASDSNETEKQCIEVGMNQILHKPFLEKELFDKIFSLLNKDPYDKRNMIIKETYTSNINEYYNGYNLKEIYNISNNNEEFVKDMIKLLIKTTNEGVEAIKKGVKNNSWEYVAYQAHKMSAPYRHIEAMVVYKLLKSIEEKVRLEHTTINIELLVQEMENEIEKLIPSLELELDKIQQ